jgi:hypothetical protein
MECFLMNQKNKMGLLALYSLLLVLMYSNSFAQSTIYGLSGYGFVPDAFVSSHKAYGIALDPEGQYISARGVFGKKQKLEVGISSVYGMVDPDLGYHARRTNVPIVPSLKFNIIEEKQGNKKMAYSMAVMWPYGFMMLGSWVYSFPVVSPEITAGIGIPSFHFTPLYTYGSLRLRLSDLSGNPLPLSIIAQGGLAASTGSIGTFEEAFYAAGIQMNIGRNFLVDFYLRVDPTTYYLLDENDIKTVPFAKQNTEGEVGIRLHFAFDSFSVDKKKSNEPSKGAL